MNRPSDPSPPSRPAAPDPRQASSSPRPDASELPPDPAGDPARDPADKTLFGHPRGLFVLFSAEMWERFSFYGMRALLTLYMVKVLAYNDIRSSGVYAAYGALVYMFPVLGGLIADKILGYKRSIILGGLLMAIGHGVMAVENEISFYIALAFLCVGNGFFKPNISSAVGKLYQPGDARRDAGFTIFYMGINLGSMLAPFVCGPLGENVGWHYGFGAAAIGMLLGLVVFVLGTGLLKGRIEAPNPALARRYQPLIWIGSFLVVPLIALLLRFNDIVHYLVPVVFIGVLATMYKIAQQESKVGRDRLYALMILMFFHTIFWAFFEQAGSSLTLFADRCVNRAMPFVGEKPASWFNGVNGAFILMLAIPFSTLWTRLAERNKQPSIPAKFVLGLALLGAGFAALVVGTQVHGIDGRTSWAFLILLYFLHTCGELCLSPVGLSAVTKLAPQRITALIMGGWFLTFSLGHTLAGFIAKLTNISFAPQTLLHELTKAQYGLPPELPSAPGEILNLIQKGDKLEDALPLDQLIQELGERGISPEEVVNHLQRQGHLSAEQLSEFMQVVPGSTIGQSEATIAALQSHVVGPVTEVYAGVYTQVAIIALASALLLMLLIRPLKKLMHGIE